MNSLPQEKEAGASWLREARHEPHALPIEKMPQLNASLERFSEAIGETLNDVCGQGSLGSTEHISTVSTFEFFGTHRGQPAVVLKSRALEARALMVFGEETVEAVLNSMFGIEPGVEQEADPAPKRERTALENELIAGVARILVVPLQEAFAPVASFDLGVEKIADIVDESLLGARDMPAILAQYRIKSRGGAFHVSIAFPQTITTPLEAMFARGPDPNAAKIDPQWTRQMEQGVTRAKLGLTAILDEFEMSLGDVAGFAVGVTLPLSTAGDAHVRIECAERGVFLCRLAERGDRYALEIEDILASAPEETAYAFD